MRIKNLLIILLLSILFNCSEKPKPSIVPQIIPEPSEIELTNGDFILSSYYVM